MVQSISQELSGILIPKIDELRVCSFWRTTPYVRGGIFPS